MAGSPHQHELKFRTRRRLLVAGLFGDHPLESHPEVVQEIIDNKGKDIGRSWVSTSRFLFYCQVAVFVALVVGGCYTMYVKRYQGKPNVEIPGNTQYNPQYK